MENWKSGFEHCSPSGELFHFRNLRKRKETAILGEGCLFQEVVKLGERCVQHLMWG